jgi:Fur family ferric uptake transcriptional regulator
MDAEKLKALDLKTTKKRMLIISILEKCHSPLTAEEIHEYTSKQIPMNLSTIYRTLSILTEKKVLLKNLSQDGKSYYQLNTNLHKHTLMCTLCNKIMPIEDCPLQDFEDQLSKSTNYTITGHSLEFTGICPTCSKLKESIPDMKH